MVDRARWILIGTAMMLVAGALLVELRRWRRQLELHSFTGRRLRKFMLWRRYPGSCPPEHLTLSRYTRYADSGSLFNRQHRPYADGNHLSKSPPDHDGAAERYRVFSRYRNLQQQKYSGYYQQRVNDLDEQQSHRVGSEHWDTRTRIAERARELFRRRRRHRRCQCDVRWNLWT